MTSPRLISSSRRLLVALTLCCLLLSYGFAQEDKAVPQLVKFSGTLAGSNSANASVVFALYKDSNGGTPLWQEVQSVTLDSSGHYTVLLGARSRKGVPQELFATGEARWLGVSVQGQAEQPRVLLVSVPYAMKASDSETLGGVPASAFVQRSELTSYVNSAAINAAVKSAAVAAITAPSTTTAGTLALFSDTTGDLGASSLFQVLSGTNAGNIGIGTKNPLGTLTLLGDNPTMRIENYSGTDFGSPNFNFYTANGTSASPTGTLNGDNLGQFASAGYIPGVGFPGTKVKVNFVAAENWSTTGNGTQMYFSTTPAGSTTRGVQMIIDGNGNVGIGNSSNPNPTTTDKLYVKGNIHSSTGYVFPDGTSQTTAAKAGVSSVTAGDTSITVGGTATAPTVAVNTSTIQKRIANPCPSGQAIASVNSDGSVNCVAVGGGTGTAPNNSQYLGLFGPGDGIQDPGEVGGAGARLHTDQPITVTDVTYAPTDPGSGACTPALARVTNGTVYEDIPIPVPTTTYNTAAHQVLFPANSDISVTLVQAAYCGSDGYSGPPMAFSGSVRYHVTNTGDATACPPNLTLSNGSCVDTKNDAQNCGTAGNVCPTTGNTLATCSNGTCVNTRSCNAGYADCDGNAANGCETNLATSTTSCGYCGNACPTSINNGTAACINSSCQPVCNSGFQQCFDGCTKTASDPNNCGACGNVCGAGQSCSSGACVGGSATVGGSTVTVFVSPSSLTLAPGQNANFSAQVSNGGGVSWSVQEGTGGGSISSSGAYTAPATAGIYHVVATSSTSSQAKGVATISVVASAPQPPVFTSTPPLTAMPGQPYSYTISATDPLGGTVSFSTYSPSLSVNGNVLSGMLGGFNQNVTRGGTTDVTVIATTSEGGTASQTWTVTFGGNVFGSEIGTYVTESGATSQVPDNMSDVGLSALSPIPSGYQSSSGYGQTDGSFWLYNVPVGGYFVGRNNNNFIWFTGDNPDLGYSQLSRPYLAYDTTFNTNLNLSLTGLATTTTSDFIAIYDNDAACDVWSYDHVPASVNSWTDDIYWNGQGLPVTGDNVYITQMSASVVKSQKVMTPGSYSGPVHFALTDGNMTSLSVPMTILQPSGKTYRLNVKGSAWAAMRTAVNPVATEVDSWFDLTSMPTTSYGPAGASTDLLFADFGTSLTGDLDLGDVPYNNPFPSQYVVFTQYGDMTGISYTAPNATKAATRYFTNTTNTLTPASATAPMSPLVGPPTSPQIDGMSLFAPQTISELMPTISWSAPSVGTANWYEIWVRHLNALSNGQTYVDQTWVFQTPLTSFKVPSGLLTAGGAFYVAIRAVYEPNTDFGAAPQRRTFPWAWSDLGSAMVTISPTAMAGSAPASQLESRQSAPVLMPTQEDRMEERLMQHIIARHMAFAEKKQ